MNGFLAELGKKLADQWLDRLVLPGALWVSTLIAATRLGQERPFDLGRLRAWLDAEAGQRGSHSLATVLLAAAWLLAAAAAAGFCAAALGGILQRMWALPGRGRPLIWVVRARQRRWDEATRTLKKAMAVAANPAVHDEDPARANRRVYAAERRRKALGVSRPERPTRIADCFYSAAARVRALYGLDLDIAWPRLWTLLPEALRTDLATAQDAYTAASRLTAWGLLYALLAIAWWPAAPLGIIVLVAGWLRARATARVLADLMATAADLYTSDLAAKLGIPTSMPLTPAAGRTITNILRNAHPPSAASDPANPPAPSPGAQSTPSDPDGSNA